MAGTATAAKPAASSTPAAKRVIGPKLGIARIRCQDPQCSHSKPAWFRAMFILLANSVAAKELEKKDDAEAKSADGGATGGGAGPDEPKDTPPVFTLWQSDENGYLSPVKTQEEKDKEAEKKKRIADAAAQQAEKRKQQKKDFDKAVLDYKKQKAAYDKAVKNRPALEAAYQAKMAAWEKKKAANEAKNLPAPPQPAALPDLPPDPGPAPTPPEPAVVEPDLSGLDSPFDSIKLADGEEYLLHLALCADEATARQYLKDANAAALKGKDGKPKARLKLTLTAEVTGQALEKGQRTKSDVKESVFVVDQTPDFLAGEGGEIYDHMVLFYTEIVREEKLKKNKVKRVFLFSGMPNGECPRVIKQVEKLQVHLGAMRFPLGTNGMPYVGSRIIGNCPFLNRGIFDALTYGAVVAFQNAASAGKYHQLDKAVYPNIINIKDAANPSGDYGIKPAAYDDVAARKLSPKFLEGSESSAAISLPANGTVDKATADAIKTWLDNGRRKSGKILVALHPDGGGGAELGEWMRQEAREKYSLWKQAVTDLGWDKTITAGHVFRDTRTAVVEAPPGMATRSIHKAGMAADMAMSNYGPTHSDFPVVFMWDLNQKGTPKPGTDPLLNTEPDVRWRLFGRIAKAAWVAGKDKFLQKAKDLGLPVTIFRDEVRSWSYNPKDFSGGADKVEKAEGGKFLDLTSVGAVFGFEPISTAGQWAFRLNKVGELTSPQNAMNAFLALVKMSASNSQAPLVVRRPSRTGVEMVQLNEIDLELLDRWFAKFSPVSALAQGSPDITLSALGVDEAEREVLLSVLETDFGVDPMIVRDYTGTEIHLMGQDVRLMIGPMEILVRPDTGPYSPAKDDAIYSGVDGVARCQEWWHFQFQGLINPASGRKTWSGLLEEIGYSKAGLLKLGYPPSDMTDLAY